ncbi:hypothetical protein FKP32DRAFT_833802 [Trametes sanguinea]|nr:hypothetical protein FKP32DRAFT_833802 [Trametes sanguinea]
MGSRAIPPSFLRREIAAWWTACRQSRRSTSSTRATTIISSAFICLALISSLRIARYCRRTSPAAHSSTTIA